MLLANFIFLLIIESILIMKPTMWHVTKTICEITATLSISFFASFIFYFVQVHMPDIRHKANVYPSVAKLFHRILITEKALLLNYVGTQSYGDLTENVIKMGVIRKDVNLQNAPLFLAGDDRNANWLEYGFHQVNDIDKYWDMMMNYSFYLDSECISIMADIQEDSLLNFFRTIRRLYRCQQIGELHGIDELFLKFWQSIQSQEKYYNENFAIFSPY